MKSYEKTGFVVIKAAYQPTPSVRFKNAFREMIKCLFNFV